MQISGLDAALSSVPDSKDGLLIWIIEDISGKIRASLSPRCIPTDSPRFQSLIGEHPLNVLLFWHGDRLDNRKFISIHLALNPGGNNSLIIPVTFCLVDQINHHEHYIQQTNVHLTRQNIGTIVCFPQFIQTTNVYVEGSRFVKDDTLCLIVKLHENQLNQYNNYSVSIQNALQQINSLTIS
jgi:hypothetical protein